MATLSQSFYQNSDCTVYGREDTVSGAVGGSVYKQGPALIWNGDLELKDGDSDEGCNLPPITGEDEELPFTPVSGPYHPFPFTEFELSANSTCDPYEEADLYWTKVGT